MSETWIVAKRELKNKFNSKATAFSFIILLLFAAVAPWISHLTHPSGQNDFHFKYINLSENDLKSVAQAFNNKFITSGDKATFTPASAQDVSGEKLSKGSDGTLIGPLNQLQLKNVDRSNIQFMSALETAQTQLFQQLYFQIHPQDQKKLNQYLNSHTLKVTYRSNTGITNYPLATGETTLLYILIILGSSTLAMGIVEEKANKVMEILVSAIRPRRILLGKILGLSIFTILQFIFVTATSITSSHLAGANYFDGVTATEVIQIVIWFIPCLAFFAFLNGGLGALISRTEEIGSIQGPLNIILMACMYASIFASLSPNALWVEICAYVPPVSFFVEPSRLITNASHGSEFIMSYLLALASVFALSNLMLKVFERSVLRGGKSWKVLFTTLTGKGSS